jgi:hypothetical protein
MCLRGVVGECRRKRERRIAGGVAFVLDPRGVLGHSRVEPRCLCKSGNGNEYVMERRFRMLGGNAKDINTSVLQLVCYSGSDVLTHALFQVFAKWRLPCQMIKASIVVWYKA